MTIAPSLFVSHGSPMFAVEPGQLGPRLAELGRSLAGVRAVLVVSPHWQTRGLRVMGTARPDTIHDFGGFPPVLYTLRYDVAGAPDVAAQAATLLANAGFAVAMDEQRGLDHGAWVPLRHLRPQADLPVFQVSLPHDIDPAGALRLGATLAPLREQGVMIIGSGSMTHNLYEFRQHIQDPEYAQQFADWIRAAVVRRDVDSLVDYRHQAPHAQRAHPTEEHYLPLLVALGASRPEDTSRFLEGGMTYGVLSMDSYVWSAP